MRTKIKQLTLVAGAVVLGAFLTLNVFTADAENQNPTQEQTVNMQMESNSVANLYAIGDEGKCGEGKCGEGKSTEKKKSEKKTEKKKEKKDEKKKAEKKKSESKCGEGKCG